MTWIHETDRVPIFEPSIVHVGVSLALAGHVLVLLRHQFFLLGLEFRAESEGRLADLTLQSLHVLVHLTHFLLLVG